MASPFCGQFLCFSLPPSPSHYFLFPKKKVAKKVVIRGASPYVSPFSSQNSPDLRSGSNSCSHCKYTYSDYYFPFRLCILS